MAGFPWVLEERVGEGQSAVVWRAHHCTTGERGALKVARDGAVVVREAALLARTGRRWGPRLLDVGIVPSGAAPLAPHACFVALEWIEGVPLDPKSCTERERTAAMVAHGVGRALAELHDLGVRHGDVKPTNVLLATPPTRDRADDRGCTLIDLGLAGVSGGERVWGATPRYLAPELRRSLDGAGPEADLFALGLTLGEILDERVARTEDPRAEMARWSALRPGPFQWADALVAEAPGGRPSADWVADRAAKWLGLLDEPSDRSCAREAHVGRAYVAARSAELLPGATISPAVTGLPRAWLEEALTWVEKVARLEAGASTSEPRTLGPMSPMVRARWLTRLAGPIAADWPLALDVGSEGELAARLVAMARMRSPRAWTLDDVCGRGDPTDSWEMEVEDGLNRVARLGRELARPRPDRRAMALAEDDLSKGSLPATLVVDLGAALLRAGEFGRAWVAVQASEGAEADLLRAEIARRRGDVETARTSAKRALDANVAGSSAVLARLAWDAGDLTLADRLVRTEGGPAAAEVRALIAYRRGDLEAGIALVNEALAQAPDMEPSARLEATRGMLEHARGDADASVASFARAVELAMRGGAVIEEATYLTGLAAAAADAGDIAQALASATRAALLWERLGRPALTARALLARAAALATVGAVHGADEAAVDARARSLESGDVKAAAYARWASVEVRGPGDPRARAEAVAADEELAGAADEDRVRAAARLLVWAPDAIDDARIARVDALAEAASAPARWEWWGAHAVSFVLGRRGGTPPEMVLAALVTLIDVRAPLGSRGPALAAGVRLATELGDGEAARRLEGARRSAAKRLREGTPPSLLASLASVAWSGSEAPSVDVSLAPAQISQLESIARALSTRDRLRPLLEQVLDTMVLWSGVERGLLLLRAPDGRLVPRAARNLARRDLRGEQLALSQGIARRALDTGEAVVATDAFASLGDLHASVHALKLRSVLAVPLVARGESLGVVYLDDRARRGAFGPSELAWVRLVASQAATAIADARDQVLLKRAVRHAERAKTRLEELLSTRNAELDATRAELSIARDGAETRFRYDAIAGRSEPMRALLALLDRITGSDVPVLLIGESGTGKELVARALHANGPRTRRPFVSENCASLPETLLESALFGHVRGAFTGASSTRAGLFDVADGGTLFLDEIGEMSLAMQSKLLRVLEDGEVRPVGGERARKVDVRIIGATHRDLEAMVLSKTFREDLFYRLNVISVRIPPLRERAEDIPLLVAHFLEKHAPGRKVRLTRPAMDRLRNFPWPGNVRQLENEVRRAIVLADGAGGAETIDVAELSADVARGGPSAARGAHLGLRSRVDALETELVRDALEKNHGNQTRAAEALGVSRFGLQKMMKRLKIVGRTR